MAEMDEMLKRMEKASSRHSKTQEKIEALKRQLAEEEKTLQREKDRINERWMKRFAALAEKQGIVAYELDQEKLLDMVAEDITAFVHKKGLKQADAAKVHDAGKVAEA